MCNLKKNIYTDTACTEVAEQSAKLRPLREQKALLSDATFLSKFSDEIAWRI